MIKIVYIIAFCLFISAFANSQEAEISATDKNAGLFLSQPVYSGFGGIGSQSLNNDFSYRLSVGSSYSNFFGNDVFTNYVMPEVSYNLSNDLRFSVGTIVSHSNFNIGSPLLSESSSLSHKQRTANYYMFARGEYDVTDRFRIRGATLFGMDQSNNSAHNSVYNFGVDLRLGNNSFLHADITIRNINNPHSYYNTLYGTGNMFGRRSSFGSPASPMFY